MYRYWGKLHVLGNSCACMDLWLWRPQENQLSFLRHHSPRIVRRGLSLSCISPSRVGWPVSEPRDLPVSTFPTLGLQAHTRDPNSGPDVQMASTQMASHFLTFFPASLASHPHPSADMGIFRLTNSSIDWTRWRKNVSWREISPWSSRMTLRTDPRRSRSWNWSGKTRCWRPRSRSCSPSSRWEAASLRRWGGGGQVGRGRCVHLLEDEYQVPAY